MLRHQIAVTRLEIVSWTTNSPTPARQRPSVHVASTALGRCNCSVKRPDMVGCPTCTPSIAWHVTSGTSRKVLRWAQRFEHLCQLRQRHRGARPPQASIAAKAMPRSEPSAVGRFTLSLIGMGPDFLPSIGSSCSATNWDPGIKRGPSFLPITGVLQSAPAASPTWRGCRSEDRLID